VFDVEGFILVGGASRRMGRDKAQLVIDGQTFIERIAGELSAIVSSVALVGARQPYGSLRNIPDLHTQWGALGGIHAALSAAKTDWAVIVGCDLPFVTRELFERLKSFTCDAVDAVVPIQSDGRPQPVCAFYRRESCLQQIEELISAGEHTPRALLAKVRPRYVESSELGDLPNAENFFFNVNTPEDFEHARTILTRSDHQLKSLS
jgi:molybdopterin-guanine dinucleotide biosynthesis protein A